MSNVDLSKEPSHKPGYGQVRIAAVQYLLRSIDDWDGFENQVRDVSGDFHDPAFVVHGYQRFAPGCA